MKLRFNPASPFARKVRIVARETGAISRLEETACMVSPVAPNRDLALENPLVKIPTLITDDGKALYDSRVICEYLDSLHDASKLFPAAAGERFAALRYQALGDGVCDAAVLCRYEVAVRPEALRWHEWIAGQKTKIFGALDLLEQEPQFASGQFAIGQIAVFCALGYLDFRFADWNWRAGRPRLTAWQTEVSTRPSVLATKHE